MLPWGAGWSFLKERPQVLCGCPPNRAVDAFIQRRSKRALDGAGKDSPPAPSQRELRGLPEKGRFRLRHGLAEVSHQPRGRLVPPPSELTRGDALFPILLVSLLPLLRLLDIDQQSIEHKE